MLVKDIMTRNVISVKPGASLRELTRILTDYRINGVPVVEDDGNLVGIITMTDLLKILRDINYWDGIEKLKPDVGIKDALLQEKEHVTVSRKMTTMVSTVLEDDPVDRVIDLMCKHNVHTIPVVKNNKLVGVVGATDIVKLKFL